MNFTVILDFVGYLVNPGNQIVIYKIIPYSCEIDK